MDIAIIGVGNELREDDGIGPVVVRALEKGVLHVKADFYNLNLDYFELSGLIPKYRFVFIIDALPTGPEPGRVRIFRWSNRLVKRKNLFSLHDLDLLCDLEMVFGHIQGCDSNLWLIGIRAASVGWNANLSPEISAKLPLIIEEISSKIKVILNLQTKIHNFLKKR